MAKHDDGSGIISYDSFDELLEDQRRAHEAAMANMTASQRGIPIGGYACNLSAMDDKDGPPIFGCIQSTAEVRAWHQLYYGIGDLEAARAILAERAEFDPPSRPGEPGSWKEDGFASAEEAIQDAVLRHVDSWTSGYLFGTWLSAWEPRGEPGSAHASVCVPISREVWLEAKAHGGYVSTASAHEISAAIGFVRAEIQAREGATEGEGDDDADVSKDG